MVNPPTTIGLIVLTLLSGGASFIAWRRLLRPAVSESLRASQLGLIWLVALGAISLFLYRWLVLRADLQPLESHVDGLLLVTAILAPTTLFLQSRTRLPGLGAFSQPPLTLLLLWAVCASQWTFKDFRIASVWLGLHTVGVYLGTASLVIAAVAGGMFLFAQKRLHATPSPDAPPIASLERIERVSIVASGVGFGLLTVGLITGLVIVSGGPTRLGAGWWHSPKIVLSTTAWAICALVMNVRHGSSFRGKRAAWMSIAGLVVLLATFAVVNALPGDTPSQPPQEPGSPAAPEARP